MKQEILTLFPWMWLSKLALLIFFFFFVGLIIRVSLKSRKNLYHQLEQMPLNDGVKHE